MDVPSHKSDQRREPEIPKDRRCPLDDSIQIRFKSSSALLQRIIGLPVGHRCGGGGSLSEHREQMCHLNPPDYISFSEVQSFTQKENLSSMFICTTIAQYKLTIVRCHIIYIVFYNFLEDISCFCATPAELLAASMAAEPFCSTYLRAGTGGARNQDLSCHRSLSVRPGRCSTD